MSELEQLYQQVILDHARSRSGNMPLLGRAGADGAGFGSSHQVNPSCGDEITVETEVDPESGAVVLRWDGQGCSISMASASVMTELHEELDDAEFAAAEAGFHELMHSRGRIDADEELLGDGAAFAGVSKFPMRIKCALLPWMALKDSIAQAEATSPNDSDERLSSEGGRND